MANREFPSGPTPRHLLPGKKPGTFREPYHYAKEEIEHLPEEEQERLRQLDKKRAKAKSSSGEQLIHHTRDGDFSLEERHPTVRPDADLILEMASHPEARATDRLWTVHVAIYADRVFLLLYEGLKDDPDTQEAFRSQHGNTQSVSVGLFIGSVDEVRSALIMAYASDEFTIRTIRAKTDSD